jgi:7-cyano-7-deazaguanine synthase in queuosine biosynthesis
MIWYGPNYSDVENGFPDCTNEWVNQVNQLLKINGSVGIRLEAPLLNLNLTKDDVMNMLYARGVKVSDLYSGYLEDNKYKVNLDFLGGRKLPKIKASDIVGTSFADDDKNDI